MFRVGLTGGIASGKSTVATLFSELGAGLGIGARDFRAILVFHTDEVLKRFVESGWEFGGEADAAAKTSERGGEASGAASATKEMTIYQFTKQGLAVSATVSGTKYWKDGDLN